MIERHVVSEALADQLLKEYQAGASFFFSSLSGPFWRKVFWLLFLKRKSKALLSGLRKF